ncbi:metal ABC transporter permease [Lentisphaerota bacterium WC36G]|nr:metal ABC transporter permease [Lentisphaerae bacterium WC36]
MLNIPIASIYSIITLQIIFGIIASLTFGIIGTFVVVKRISYIAGAISHSILGGIGVALYCQEKLDWSYSHPLLGALISALLAAIIIGLMTRKSHQRIDTVIGAIWAIGMATGVLCIAKLEEGYKSIHSYLFGSIALTGQQDLIIVSILGVLILIIVMLFYDKLLAICFDSEFSELRGIKVDFYYILLLCLIALTIVILVQMIGIIMLIALLTLPAAVACNFFTKLSSIMISSVIICMLFTTSGFFLSIPLKSAVGPVIIIVAGISYLTILVTKYLYFKIKNSKNST